MSRLRQSACSKRRRAPQGDTGDDPLGCGTDAVGCPLGNVGAMSSDDRGQDTSRCYLASITSD